MPMMRRGTPARCPPRRLPGERRGTERSRSTTPALRHPLYDTRATRSVHGELGGSVAGAAVVAGQQACQGGQGPDGGAVGVRRCEEFLGGGAAYHVEEARAGA